MADKEDCQLSYSMPYITYSCLPLSLIFDWSSTRSLAKQDTLSKTKREGGKHNINQNSSIYWFDCGYK